MAKTEIGVHTQFVNWNKGNLNADLSYSVLWTVGQIALGQVLLNNFKKIH